MSRIGPGGVRAGGVVGLIPALEKIGTYGPTALEGGQALRDRVQRFDAVRGHNDQPEERSSVRPTVASSSTIRVGQRVQDLPGPEPISRLGPVDRVSRMGAAASVA